MSNLQKDFLRSKLAKLPPLPSLDDQDEQDSLGDLRARPTRRQPRRPPSSPAPSIVPAYFAQSFFTSSSASPSFKTYYTEPKLLPGDGPGSVMVFHHGGGEGALGFALVVKEITRLTNGELGLLAFDCRGHGDTSYPEGSLIPDLSLETLTSDFSTLIETVFPEPKASPALVLIGHSMGAAPVLEVGPRLQQKGYKVAGVGVLDVVEGSALEALPLMSAIISSRPSSFGSIGEAIDWHLSSNTYRSVQSAQLSVPSILQPLPAPSTRFTWRTSLIDSAPFWKGWYEGLSAKFLAAKSARLLVLAGSDRMDKELMIGQMQGKFQHVVLPNVGHHLQQDDPDRLADVLVDFWRRNEGVNLKGIKKVGEL